MSQEIENNFEERKKDWDLTGLLDDVIRRYIYQLTNDELNEINLEKASGMPDEEIKNGIKLPLATMQQRRETWGSQSKLDVQEPMIFQEALSVDNGKGFIIFLDPEKNYNVYRPDEKGILQTPSGSLSGKEFSKYTEQSDETHRLDYIPYAETETPSEAPQKQSSKAKSMEKTVSQSSPDVSTQEAAFPVTINRSLVDDIMDDKTFISRIPGSKLHIKLPLFSIADDGKTLVSAIDPQKEYEIFKNDSPTSNPLLNMKGAQILPYYDPVRRKNITKQFGQNQNKILKFSQNPASKHKPKSSPIRKKDLKL